MTHWRGRPVNSVAWSGDGTRVASGGDDGRVVVWDARSGEEVQAMPKKEFDYTGWLRALTPGREAKLPGGAVATCDAAGEVVVTSGADDAGAPSLYFGPAETFANKGVMVNADGDLRVIPATNGVELMVLVVHGDAAPASAAD